MGSEQITWDQIIGISTVIIAVTAVIFTYIQIKMSKEHNRLSIKPHLNITLEAVHNRNFCLRLTNHGIGPAIIKKYTSPLIKEKRNITSREDLVLILEKINLDKEWINGYSLSEEQGISAGDSILLFNFPLELHTGERKRQFEEGIVKLQFQIEYESIYEDKFTLQYP